MAACGISSVTILLPFYNIIIPGSRAVTIGVRLRAGILSLRATKERSNLTDGNWMLDVGNWNIVWVHMFSVKGGELV